VVTRDPVAHPSLRGFAFHFRPQTGAEERTGRVAAVLGIAPGDVLHRAERVNRLPAPVLGHEARLAGLDRLLAGGSLLVTGNYFGGLAIEDCVARSFAEAARFHALAARPAP
jgi:hypothetical protein